MTNVILIPCCKEKAPNGVGLHDVSVSAPALLCRASGQALLNARRELSHLLGLIPGPDLGAEGQGVIELMPAYKRYAGKLYKVAALTHDDAVGNSGGQVLILSALYGLVTAREQIRHYDLEMKSKLPNDGTVHTWWKQRRLGALVCEAVESLNVTSLYDLLSGSYRKALQPWPPASLRSHRQTFDAKYRPLRSGSTHHRGVDVRRLLSGE